MSPYPRYQLYRVGRGAKTDERDGPVLLRLPDLGAASGLPNEHRHVEQPIAFNPPDEKGKLDWKTVPLTEEQAADLDRRGWLVSKRDGHGEPRLPSEEKLLDAITARRDEVLAARSPAYPYLNPSGDYSYANLVRRYLRSGETKKYRIEELPESDLPFEGGLAELPAMIRGLEGLRRRLRKKGWRFHADGSAWEPPEGGHRRRFPGGLIRRAYDSLATQYKRSGRGKGIVPYLQELLRPQVGELSREEIEVALRTHLRR